jgi:hypothetical protein
MTEKNVIRTLVIIGVPIVAALIVRYIFGVREWNALFSLMSLTFFLSLPYLIGVLTIYLSDVEKVKSRRYSLFIPWLPIIGFIIVTLVFSIEGWACWIMVLPMFFLFASLGGLTARYFRLNKSNKANNLHLSLAALLPFFLGPMEKAIGEIPGFYKAYTYIDIEAPKDRIWDNVTRVRAIKEDEDQGQLTNFLQIPRPIKAELDFEGVGAKREAIFDGGLIFNETVLKYEHEKMMSFSIKANTYEIPSTTFDEHILIGGEFFDVLEGTYELEKLGQEKYRLHLYSEFKMTTTFNFYASFWGELIMKDIQENILQIIKKRSERK